MNKRPTDAGTAPDRGSAEAGLGFLLGSAHRALRSAWEERIADLGLTAPQALVLRVVAEESGMGLRELARRMQSDAMNAKRLADTLEHAGLVRSTVDPGHRQRRLLRATDEGRAMAARVNARSRALEEVLAERLGSPELEHLRTLLGSLLNGLAIAAEPVPAEGRRTPSVKEDLA